MQKWKKVLFSNSTEWSHFRIVLVTNGSIQDAPTPKKEVNGSLLTIEKEINKTNGNV